MFDIKEFLDQLTLGNGSVITDDNIYELNQLALNIYNKQDLTPQEIEQYKYLIMSCNILYNRTDMTVQAISDGFYDLLYERYKTYDEHFQVGAAVVEFKNSFENDIDNPKKIATCPIIFEEKPKRNELEQDVYKSIMRVDQPILNRYDFNVSPIEFDNDYITKRTHNTEHNHPSLVGTLDKAKFIFTNDVQDPDVLNDPSVLILERDFFQDHIKRGILDPNREFSVVCELKYDGISVEADCDLQVESARTRGDTGIGTASDITPILQGYTFKQAKCMIGEQPLGMKFEAVILKSDLERFNQLRGKNYSNCRTAIIGLFGSSDGYKYRDLITLIPLAVDREQLPQISNRVEEIEFINRVFRSNGEPLRYCVFTGNLQTILYGIKVFWNEAIIARNSLNFMYDGIVVSYLDEDIREKLGRKNSINKYSMAVKFPSMEEITTFRGYTYEVGQDGRITPMIHYDPVEFIGTIHTKSTGSSYERFNNLALKYGDYIRVTYRNDVMPYVSKVECKHNDDNPNPVIQFITNCPICGSPLVLSESGKSISCPAADCPGKTVKRMTNMFAKLNIKGFAEAAFSALGKSHLSELLDLDQDYLISKLGEADGISFYQAIKDLQSKPIKDYIIIGSLGFSGLAHKNWESILNQITLFDLENMYYECKVNNRNFYTKLISSIKIGQVSGITIANEWEFFEQDIIQILSRFNIINSKDSNKKTKLQIRFTGFRNHELSDLLISNDYDADDNASVTKKTDILLVPYDGFRSSKVSKVSEDCKIIPIDEFMNNMEYYLGEKLL